MGGSALPGEILKMLSNFFNWPINIKIHKSYNLPDLNPSNLVVIISYSGNTEEALSSYLEAKKRKLPIVAITSNGKLARFCEKDKIAYAKVPQGIQPRLAIGYQFSALAQILSNAQLITNLDYNIKLEQKTIQESAKKLAEKIIDKTPLIYSSDKFQALTYIWKINFNENSKIPAFWNYFPELNHNELNGLNNKNFYAVILRDKKIDHPRILKRMEITQEIIRRQGIKSRMIDLAGKNIIEKIFANILLASWTSYYLALRRKIDPLQVKVIENFKKKLN